MMSKKIKISHLGFVQIEVFSTGYLYIFPGITFPEKILESNITPTSCIFFFFFLVYTFNICFSIIPGLESDEEIRRVPEIGGESAGTSASGRETGSVAGPDRVQASGEGQRKRGRSPADKESKRLKRY
jgi:hypothetical protein